MGRFIDITGETFGDWYVESYEGNSIWYCTNIITGEHKKIHSYSLRKIITNDAKHVSKEELKYDITGQKFGNWEVIDYDQSTGNWLCKCNLCGNTDIVKGFDLMHGKSTRCNNPVHKLKHNYTGEVINGWIVDKYVGEMRWHCTCTCGCNAEKEVGTNILKLKQIGRCSNTSTVDVHRPIKDISGQKFNNLKVIKYTGKNNMWTCECLACGNIKDIHRDSIVTGKTKSCGCLKEKMRAETLFERYGETNTTRINNPREPWQIDIVSSKEKLQKYIESFDHIPSVYELSQTLGINDTSVIKMLRKYILDEYIVRAHNGVSDIENDLANYVKNIGCNIIQSDRTVLNGKELDIYIPDKKVAIEFNGNYWHSEAVKGVAYHQDKTIQCIKQGIHLIHVFEYEWRNEESRNKIKYYLHDLLSQDYNIVYARDTSISEIDSKIAKEFIDKYHLQGYTQSSINLGCYYNDELLGVMTFGKPRFNSDCEYELIRLCWKHNNKVIGGSGKLFKHFLSKYKPKSIVSYCDITKFKGDVYFKLGFKTTVNDLTKPNYVWVNTGNQQVLTRYQTQKQDLIKQGLGKFGDTEDEIMENLNYVKIYNSGNIRLTYIAL